MDLSPVDGSSNVKAAAFLGDIGVLLVQFQDGSVYAYRGSAEWYQMFLASPSKGEFMASARGGLKISGKESGVRAIEDKQNAAETAIAVPVAVLNVIDEEASRCCVSRLTKAFSGTIPEYFSCSECGTEFRPRDCGGSEVLADSSVDGVHMSLIEDLNELAAVLEAAGEYYYDTINVKRWVLGDGGRAGNCEYCVDASDRGWIEDDDVFESPMGDVDGPPGHPHCDCSLEYKEKRKRVYV